MENEIKTWLADIISAIEEIRLFLSDVKSYEAFKSDIKTQRAIERNLEIIGEAIGRILKIKPGFPIENARRIIDTRNRIIHGYDSVSQEIIWAIATQYLAGLEKEAKTLLESSTS